MRERLQLIKRDWNRYGRGIPLLGVYILLVGGIFHIPICPLVYITGFPCPACGMTRAAVLFLKGDFLGAWEMHPFFYVLLVWGIGAVVLRYVCMKNMEWMKYLAGVVIVAGTIYYFYRLYVYFPMKEPMVYYGGSLLGRIRSYF